LGSVSEADTSRSRQTLCEYGGQNQRKTLNIIDINKSLTKTKTMKKHTQILSLGVLLLFVCTLQLSAQNCTFSKDETDKFSGDRVLHTKPVNLIDKAIKQKGVFTIKKIEMQVKYENNKYLLSLDYHYDLGFSIVNTNYKLILLLADGSKVEAPCLQDVPSMTKKGGIPVYSYNFGISVSDFMTLMDNDITDIKMTAYTNPVEFSIDNNIKTSELFQCINSNK
jgi:hypothetical protein